MTQVAIIILGQQSLPLARRIMAMLPEAVIYGMANRTTDVDIPFDNFGDTLRALFTDGTPIIGICAAGILIRTLAPLLSDKSNEPPVLAVAEDGSAVVPLLGGLQGVNDLARQIADALHVAPAITTTRVAQEFCDSLGPAWFLADWLAFGGDLTCSGGGVTIGGQACQGPNRQ